MGPELTKWEILDDFAILKIFSIFEKIIDSNFKERNYFKEKQTFSEFLQSLLDFHINYSFFAEKSYFNVKYLENNFCLIPHDNETKIFAGYQVNSVHGALAVLNWIVCKYDLTTENWPEITSKDFHKLLDDISDLIFSKLGSRKRFDSILNDADLNKLNETELGLVTLISNFIEEYVTGKTQPKMFCLFDEPHPSFKPSPTTKPSISPSNKPRSVLGKFVFYFSWLFIFTRLTFEGDRFLTTMTREETADMLAYFGVKRLVEVPPKAYIWYCNQKGAGIF